MLKNDPLNAPVLAVQNSLDNLEINLYSNYEMFLQQVISEINNTLNSQRAGLNLNFTNEQDKDIK